MRKTIDLQEFELPILVSADRSGGFVAQCSVWKDCYAQGDTIDEVLNEISSVAASLVELYKEENLIVPLKLKKTAHKSTKSFNLRFPLIVSIS